MCTGIRVKEINKINICYYIFVFAGFWQISPDENFYTAVHASIKFTEQWHRSYPDICEKVSMALKTLLLGMLHR